MGVNMIERQQLSGEMFDALKKYILRERQKKRQEQEQDDAIQRHKREQEMKRKQDAMTLEEIKDQLTKMETKLTELKAEKHQLFSQLKKVLNEDETRRRQRESEIMSQMSAVSNMSYHPYYGLPHNNVQTHTTHSTHSSLSSHSTHMTHTTHTNPVNTLNTLNTVNTVNTLRPNISIAQSIYHNNQMKVNQLNQASQQQQQQQQQQQSQQPQINSSSKTRSVAGIKRAHDQSISPPIHSSNSNFVQQSINYKTSVTYTPTIPKTTHSTHASHTAHTAGPPYAPMGYDLKGAHAYHLMTDFELNGAKYSVPSIAGPHQTNMISMQNSGQPIVMSSVQRASLTPLKHEPREMSRSQTTNAANVSVSAVNAVNAPYPYSNMR